MRKLSILRTDPNGPYIQAAGNGAAALKYLGAYVARTAINDARMVDVTDESVTFRWKDRADGNRRKTLTLPGIEFVRRYLRHVLPRGLRSIRYYGFCHPAAKANRLRVRLHTGLPVEFGAALPVVPATSRARRCPRCGAPVQLFLIIEAAHKKRGPPGPWPENRRRALHKLQAR